MTNLRSQNIRGGLASRPSLNYLMIPIRFMIKYAANAEPGTHGLAIGVFRSLSLGGGVQDRQDVEASFDPIGIAHEKQALQS
jgi:hypothetical protein